MQIHEIPLNSREEALHEYALQCADAYRLSESKLLAAIDQVDRSRLYAKLRKPSVFIYCVECLKLSEAVALYFQTVARKSREIPELRLAIENDEISVSKAARICSVLNDANKTEWIAKASELSKRELEREVARCSDGGERRAVVKPVAKNLNRIAFDADDAFLAKLERVMGLENGKIPKVVEAALDAYLKKYDPVQKAERSKQRSARAEKTKDIPAQSKHAVTLRDQGRCTAWVNGARCSASTNLHFHHIIMRADGGSHEPENLTLLCRFHHESFHEYG